MLDPEMVARACHEANRALQESQGDPDPSPPWEDAPMWQRDSAIAGVAAARAGQTPRELHESWAARKHAEGWRYGLVKDSRAKTHPCLVPYADLPPGQRVKDAVFHAIVGALS